MQKLVAQKLRWLANQIDYFSKTAKIQSTDYGDIEVKGTGPAHKQFDFSQAWRNISDMYLFTDEGKFLPPPEGSYRGVIAVGPKNKYFENYLEYLVSRQPMEELGHSEEEIKDKVRKAIDQNNWRFKLNAQKLAYSPGLEINNIEKVNAPEAGRVLKLTFNQPVVRLQIELVDQEGKTYGSDHSEFKTIGLGTNHPQHRDFVGQLNSSGAVEAPINIDRLKVPFEKFLSSGKVEPENFVNELAGKFVSSKLKNNLLSLIRKAQEGESVGKPEISRAIKEILEIRIPEFASGSGKVHLTGDAKDFLFDYVPRKVEETLRTLQSSSDLKERINRVNQDPDDAIKKYASAFVSSYGSGHFPGWEKVYNDFVEYAKSFWPNDEVRSYITMFQKLENQGKQVIDMLGAAGIGGSEEGTITEDIKQKFVRFFTQGGFSSKIKDFFNNLKEDQGQGDRFANWEQSLKPFLKMNTQKGELKKEFGFEGVIDDDNLIDIFLDLLWKSYNDNLRTSDEIVTEAIKKFPRKYRIASRKIEKYKIPKRK